MKKIITLLLVMCSLSVIAQEYTPLVREGVKWECVSEQIGWGDEKKVPYKIYFDGDSIVGDITYKKCYIETESLKKIVALMREDVNSKKVYIRYGTFPADIQYNTPIIDGLDGVDADAEYLLYDFSEIGNSDVIKMASEESGGYLAGAQIVKSTMLVGDKICNRSQVFDSDKKPLYSIVEGLGFIPEYSTAVSVGVAQNLYEGTMLDFLFYDSDTDGWTNFSYFNRLVADDGTVLYESPNTYTPLVREGVKWNCLLCGYSMYSEEDNFEHKYHIEFKGDTIINDKAYKKCYYIFENSANYPNETPRAFVREDVAAKKVYAIFNSEYKHDKVDPMIDIYNSIGELYSEFLLYDFSDISNSEQYWTGGYGAENFSETVITVGETDFKMITIEEDFGPDMHLVEGIGFSHGNSNAKDMRGCGDLLVPSPSIWLGGYNFYPLFLNFEDANGNILYDSDIYTPLVREGVKWECALKVIDYKEDGGYEESIYPYSIELNGSTKIDSLYYTNCYYVFEDENIATSDIPRAFLREDVAERKVYARFNPDYHYNGIEEPQFVGMDHSGNGDVLLYDFANMTNPEQSWNLYFENATVETYRLELGGKRLVKHDLDCLQFIESIGFAGSGFGDNPYGDLLAPMEQYMPCICDMSYSMFYRFIDNGTVVYENPLTNIDGVEKDADTAVETARYDIYGRRLSRPVQGINIIKMSDGTTRKVFTK